jgi:hypothetical protein
MRMGSMFVGAAAVMMLLACEGPKPMPPTTAPPPERPTTQALVPRRFVIKRIRDAVEVRWDTERRRGVAFDAYPSTTKGVETELSVLHGDKQLEHEVALASGFSFDGATHLYAGLAAPSASEPLVLVAKVTLFETDVPPGHHWMPRSGKYRVLWEGMVTQTIPP